MSAVVISEIDIAKARYPSSLWAYAGLDVVATDWKGRSRHKEHLRQISYISKDGKPATRLGITFNPLLKTKLTGVLGPCFIKAGSDPYKTIYDGYKHRLESHPKWSASTKAHRHNAAIRYMIKRFLCDLYAAWRPGKSWKPARICRGQTPDHPPRSLSQTSEENQSARVSQDHVRKHEMQASHGFEKIVVKKSHSRIRKPVAPSEPLTSRTTEWGASHFIQREPFIRASHCAERHIGRASQNELRKPLVLASHSALRKPIPASEPMRNSKPRN